MAPNSALCRSILISIANPRVFHSALHTGSDTGKEYGLHCFPRAILRQLEANTDAKWMVPFALPPGGETTSTSTGSIPKNSSIRFGAHRDSIYNTSQVTRSGPLAPSAPAATKQAHVGALTQHHPSPLIMEVTILDHQTALANLPEELDPVTLPALLGRFFQMDDMDTEATESFPPPPRPQRYQTQHRTHRLPTPRWPHPSQNHKGPCSPPPWRRARLHRRPSSRHLAFATQQRYKWGTSLSSCASY
jgi:hypothetical protein